VGKTKDVMRRAGWLVLTGNSIRSRFSRQFYLGWMPLKTDPMNQFCA
jgi:hypothetical protein